jgi:hypothetical protein
MGLPYKKKYFYERNQWLLNPETNLKYEEVLMMRYADFEAWVDLFRKRVIETWDTTGAPPKIGVDEPEMIEQFSKLQAYKVEKFEEVDDDGNEVIFNFNKFATPVNQFFPAMYKTKIGGSTYDSPKPSIYDVFVDDTYLPLFIKQMRRLTRQDGMYRFSKTLHMGNPDFHNSHIQTGKEWIEKWMSGDKLEGHDFCLSQANSKIPSPPINAEEVKELYKSGKLEYKHISSLKTAEWGENIDSLVDIEKQPIQICIYPLGQTIFPEATAAFRIGMGTQPAVNFPPLTAKYLYKRFTDHVKDQDVVNIYDPSAGWGGRILGAMSLDDRNIHYIGNDPNTENYIEEIGKTRYEYLAEFFNENTVGASNAFWGHQNTYDIFQTGSEIIHLDSRFQAYKGKLDMVFTSPPYFDRERYSDDESQSFRKFNSYESWRDGFLTPTLTTAFEWLKNDRYILWNIADIKVGKDKWFTLEQDSIDILTELGCEYKGKLRMTMSPMTGIDMSGVKNSMRINGTAYKYEPIFIFYKP